MKTGGNYEDVPTGSYGAVCYKIIDIGTQESTFNNETKKRHQVIIGWELSEKMKDGKPFSITKFYTLSLHEKATLRSHLEAWLKRPLTEADCASFDPKSLLGKPFLVNVGLNKKGRSTVLGFASVPKGVEVPTPVNPTVYFDLESFDETVFNSLSDKLKDIIRKSPEYAEAIGSADIPL